MGDLNSSSGDGFMKSFAGNMQDSLGGGGGSNAPAPQLDPGITAAGMAGGQAPALPNPGTPEIAPVDGGVAAAVPVAGGVEAPQMEAPVAKADPAPSGDYIPQVSAADNWQGDKDWGSEADAVKVEGFKKGKRNIIGQIADHVLMAYGRPARYEPAMHQKDLNEAARGYIDHPMEAIQRVMQVDRKEGMALLKDYRDRQKDDAYTNGLESQNRNRVSDKLTGMYYQATPENFEQINGLANRMLKANRFDPEEFGLPTTYEEAKNYAFTGYSVPKQAAQQGTDANRARTRTEVERHNQVGEGVAQERLGLSRRNTDSMIAARERGATSGGVGVSGGKPSATDKGAYPPPSIGSYTAKLPPARDGPPEGTVQKNSKTGKYRVFKDGKWVEVG